MTVSKPAVYKDREFGRERADFEAKAIEIRDNFKVKELCILESQIDDFMQFLASITEANATPWLVELVKKITREEVLVKPVILVTISFKEKIASNNLINQIEDRGCRGLDLLEHLMFLFLFQDVHCHSQVISFNSGVSHGAPDFGTLGIRAFVYPYNSKQLFLYTCVLKGETFKNVFVPMTTFVIPATGRK